jgi:hypothetical protein
MIQQWPTNPNVSIIKIARKAGVSKQNVSQFLKRLDYSKDKGLCKRPWGATKRFIPEIEVLLHYLYNRFDGRIKHIDHRLFEINGKRVLIQKRNCVHYTSLVIGAGNRHNAEFDYKIVLHHGQLFVVESFRNYLPISEMPHYHNRLDFLE